MPPLFLYLRILNFEINYKNSLVQPLCQLAKMPGPPKLCMMLSCVPAWQSYHYPVALDVSALDAS